MRRRSGRHVGNGGWRLAESGLQGGRRGGRLRFLPVELFLLPLQLSALPLQLGHLFIEQQLRLGQRVLPLA
jgi:hypothetical protein